MAAVRSRVSLPIFRTKNPSVVTESGRSLAPFCLHTNDFSPSSSTNIPLLQKLLKAPLSRIKPTLDSEFSSESPEFPWASLLSSLNTCAPQKANLVIEWKLEKLMKERGENHNSYAQLISLCANIRNFPIALLIFSSMESQGVKSTASVFNALISTSLSSGNLLTALSLFEIMEGSEGYKPNSDTYDAFVLAYANLGNQSATETWFSAKMATGFSIDAQNYYYLILCCVKSKQYEDAERYYEEMMLAGLIPNESIIHSMLLMYCKQRNSGKVKEFLKVILDSSWQIDINMAKNIVGFYQELGLIEEMEDLLVVLTKFNQTLEVLSLLHRTIIQIYAHIGRLDEVEYSVGRMLSHGISFSCSADIEKVICCYFRLEAYDRLDLFLERIKGSYTFTRSIFYLLSAGYRRAGLSEKSNLVVNEMKMAGYA